MVNKQPHYPMRLKMIVAPLVFLMAMLLGSAAQAPQIGVVLEIVGGISILNL